MSLDEDSPIPAITDEEIRRHVVGVRRDLKEIKTALMGNDMGTEGVIPRLRRVEGRVEGHDRKLLVWGSILSASGTALVFLKDLALKK